MIGNITCWAIALALIMSRSIGLTGGYATNLLFAMGFIFLGNLSKVASAYYNMSVDVDDEKADKTTKND